jgi:hypothetical protein
MMDEKVDIKKWFTGLINPVTWSKAFQYLIMIGIFCLIFYCIKQTFFPTKNNVNKPVTTVLPFAKVDKIDNTNTQISIEREKPFEVGAGVGGGRIDDKDAYGAMVWGKIKF